MKLKRTVLLTFASGQIVSSQQQDEKKADAPFAPTQNIEQGQQITHGVSYERSPFVQVFV
jgi:hypothetical protein